MENARFIKGMERLSAVDGHAGEAVIRSLADIAPDLGQYIVEFAFGDIYSRPELSLRERELVTVASLLTTGGCEPQLEVHLNGLLNVGASPEQVVETILQCVPYTGFPKVLNGMFLAKKVFADRNISLSR